MRFIHILKEDFKTAATKYINSGEKPDDVKKVFNAFKEIRQRIQPPENNIDWWAKNRKFRQLKDYIDNFEGIPTKSQVGKKTGKSKNVLENNEWLITVPLDKDASCFHGKTTDWCTTKPFQPYYEQYFYDSEITLIYCIQKNTGEKWAIAAHELKLNDSEFFDKNDKSLSKDDFENKTGLDVDMILSKAFGEDIQTNVESSREQYRKAMSRIVELLNEIRNTNERNLELEKLLWYTKSKEKLQQYISHLGPAKFNKNLEIFAVNSIPNAIVYIKDPDEKIQMISAKKDGETTISYLVNTIGEDNISDKVKMEAVSNDGLAIRHLKNIYDDFGKKLQLAAVSQWGLAIKWIDNPDETVKEAAIKSNGLAIQFVDNIEDKNLQELAVSKTPESILVILRNSKKIYNDILIKVIEDITNYGSRFVVNDILDELIKTKTPIKQEYIDSILKSTDDIRETIDILDSINIELTPDQQLIAFENESKVLAVFLARYGKDSVSPETLIKMAKINGIGFLMALSGYKNTWGNEDIEFDIPEKAIEEVFKNSGYSERMFSLLNRLNIKPSLTVLKYAIQNAEYNADIVDIIKKADPTYKDTLKKIALQKAKNFDNTMLTTLVNEL